MPRGKKSAPSSPVPNTGLASAAPASTASTAAPAPAASATGNRGNGPKRWGTGADEWVEVRAAALDAKSGAVAVPRLLDLTRYATAHAGRARRSIDVPTETATVRVALEHTALVVVDMQNDFIHPNGRKAQMGGNVDAARALIPPINALSSALRAAGCPVIWVNWGNRPDRLNCPPAMLYGFSRNGVGIGDPLPRAPHAPALVSGSWDSAVDSALVQAAGSDVYVDKYRLSGFVDTPLDSVCRNLGLKTLLFAGVNVDQCVLTTLVDAYFLGYDCVLLRDCSATSSPQYCVDATYFNVNICYGFATDSKRVLAALEAPAPAAAATATPTASASEATASGSGDRKDAPAAADASATPASPSKARSKASADAARAQDDLRAAMIWLAIAMFVFALLMRHVYHLPPEHQLTHGTVYDDIGTASNAAYARAGQPLP